MIWEVLILAMGLATGFFMSLFATAYYKETDRRIIKPFIMFLKKRRLSRINPQIGVRCSIKPSNISSFSALDITTNQFKNKLRQFFKESHVSLLKENPTENGGHEFIVKYANITYNIKLFFDLLTPDEVECIILDLPTDLIKNSDTSLLIRSPSDIARDFQVQVFYETNYKKFASDIHTLSSFLIELESHIASIAQQPCSRWVELEYTRGLRPILFGEVKVTEVELELVTKSNIRITDEKIATSFPLSDELIKNLRSIITSYSK